MSDKIAKLEEELSERASEAATFRSLLEHPAWNSLMKIAEGQKTVRTASVMLSPLASMDLVLEQEFKKGEYAGIDLFCIMPRTALEQAEAEVKRLRTAIEVETENATKTPEADEPGSRVDDSNFSTE